MATFKYDLMSNVKVAFSNGRLWLGCDYDGARYHVWLTDGQRCENDALYKNPPPETPYGAPGYYDALKLDARTIFARSLIGEMRARAQEAGLLQLPNAGDARRERDSSNHSGSRTR
jgi:hypothetical protein